MIISKLHKKSTEVDTIGWWRKSIGNCANNWNLTIRPIGKCTKQNQTQNSQGFWDTNKSHNPDQKTWPSDY